MLGVTRSTRRRSRRNRFEPDPPAIPTGCNRHDKDAEYRHQRQPRDRARPQPLPEDRGGNQASRDCLHDRSRRPDWRAARGASTPSQHVAQHRQQIDDVEGAAACAAVRPRGDHRLPTGQAVRGEIDEAAERESGQHEISGHEGCGLGDQVLIPSQQRTKGAATLRRPPPP